MAFPDLDPNPKNQLGKGVLDPELEARWLADGIVFACKLPAASDLPFGVHVICRRPIADAVTDGELDNPFGVPRLACAIPIPT